MTINQLIYFVQAAELQNITRVAEKNQISQPAVSRAIKDLENEFSITLFSRNKNHLRLTEEGILFQQKTEAFLKQYNAFLNDLHGIRSDTEKPVHILSTGLINLLYFSIMYSYFRDKTDTLEIEYGYQAISPSVSLTYGQYDGLLWSLNENDPKLDTLRTTGFHAVKVGSFSQCFHVHRSVFHSSSKTITAAMLDGVPFVSFQPPFARANYLEDILYQSCRPNIIFRTEQIISAVASVNNHIAGSVLPEDVMGFDKDIDRYELKEFPDMNIYLVYQEDTPKMRTVIKLLAEFFHTIKNSRHTHA